MTDAKDRVTLSMVPYVHDKGVFVHAIAANGHNTQTKLSAEDFLKFWHECNQLYEQMYSPFRTRLNAFLVDVKDRTSQRWDGWLVGGYRWAWPSKDVVITPVIQEVADKHRLKIEVGEIATDWTSRSMAFIVSEPASEDCISDMLNSKDSYHRTIEWFDGDILSELRDAKGNVYIEKWADHVGRSTTRVLLVPSNQAAIAEYEAGRMSMLDLLVKASGDTGYLVTFTAGKYVGRVAVTPSRVNPSYLPTPTAMHDESLRPSSYTANQDV